MHNAGPAWLEPDLASGGGWDVYEGHFAHGWAEFHIATLAPDGKVMGRYWRALP